MLTPPVGQNLTLGTGSATALSQATPPHGSAGKNFSTLNPRSASAIASDTAAQPGNAGTDAAASASASAGVVPGLTRKRAPASTALPISAGLVTVPTPTTASGTSAAIAFTAASAAAVRSVTSSTGRPPAKSARASRTACAALSIVSTGMTGVRPSSEVGSSGIIWSFATIVPNAGLLRTIRGGDTRAAADVDRPRRTH